MLNRSKWVFAFLACIACLTERTLKGARDEYQMLHKQWLELNEKKEAALLKQVELKSLINSESDPAWIELVLKRELGLTPEGQTKILFKN
jgi:hypothetical protein